MQFHSQQDPKVTIFGEMTFTSFLKIQSAGSPKRKTTLRGTRLDALHPRKLQQLPASNFQRQSCTNDNPPRISELTDLGSLY